ncbi:MAG: hypothetical protein Q8M01_15445 [Rubrivivax sp.]|nr:hypothetical protein [Rubrivivax sp.]
MNADDNPLAEATEALRQAQAVLLLAEVDADEPVTGAIAAALTLLGLAQGHLGSLRQSLRLADEAAGAH